MFLLTCKAEHRILTLCKSPFLVHMYAAFQTTHKLYFVMEFMIGGSSFVCLFLFYFVLWTHIHIKINTHSRIQYIFITHALIPPFMSYFLFIGSVLVCDKLSYT